MPRKSCLNNSQWTSQFLLYSCSTRHNLPKTSSSTETTSNLTSLWITLAFSRKSNRSFSRTSFLSSTRKSTRRVMRCLDSSTLMTMHSTVSLALHQQSTRCSVPETSWRTTQNLSSIWSCSLPPPLVPSCHSLQRSTVQTRKLISFLAHRMNSSWMAFQTPSQVVSTWTRTVTGRYWSTFHYKSMYKALQDSGSQSETFT